ncbi:hypothetical protein L596_008594 [Steinernema carpocapsae]|uniref:Uncharacterized protein n=1 Tax=Steinernema carpocapsae TaxID=34508 RepID=A0A4V6A6C6_STECR|nr:hypothetical protein L596_008594 [Steinernema carpocapsae]
MLWPQRQNRRLPDPRGAPRRGHSNSETLRRVDQLAQRPFDPHSPHLLLELHLRTLSWIVRLFQDESVIQAEQEPRGVLGGAADRESTPQRLLALLLYCRRRLSVPFHRNRSTAAVRRRRRQNLRIGSSPNCVNRVKLLRVHTRTLCQGFQNE